MIINDKQVQSVMTKSSLPVGGYSVNPYVGCTHACKYCYASFMKRFTGHTEPWGTFLDVKYWPAITNPHKYDGERIVIRGQGSDGRNGGPAGDLVVMISVRPHAVFEREGYNLYCEVPLTIVEATLGAEIDVPTLEGNRNKLYASRQGNALCQLQPQGRPYIHGLC